MDAQGKSSADEMQRVEVYNMNEGGNWYLRGTGHVSIEYCQGSENVGLFVIVEDDHETILRHRISSMDIYDRQEETRISWLDPVLSTDLALSFQDSIGCSFIWSQIRIALSHLQFSNLGDQSFPCNCVELRVPLLPLNFSTLPLILKHVKVFHMSGELDIFGAEWDLFGTGHVSIDNCQGSDNVGLFVIVVSDHETIVKHRISSSVTYKLEKATMISWFDPELSVDVGLCFQESLGCAFIWAKIIAAWRALQSNSSESSETSETSHNSDETLGVNSELREFPSVEFSTLPDILKIVMELGITDRKRLVDLLLQSENFFPDLMSLFSVHEEAFKDLFSSCEILEDFQQSEEWLDHFHIMFKLVKGIISLNSPEILKKLFGDEFIMCVIGCLEYDRDAQRHRAFLKEHVVLNEAIPIKDPIALSKIHQTYRIGYIKDVILSRVLDEAAISCLNSIVESNNTIVVSLLKDDGACLQEVFTRMKLPTTSAESKKNLLLFLQELCSSSKSMQFVKQQQLFQDFVNKGLFDIITDVLRNTDKRLILAGIDLLFLFLNHDPSLLRTYLIHQEGNSLLGLLVKAMMIDGEEVSCRVLEILLILLDSYTMSRFQGGALVTIICDKHLNQLADFVAATCHGSPSGHTAATVAAVEFECIPMILSNICELFSFIVMHHPAWVKWFVLRNNLVEKILPITKRKEKYLSVTTVRFMRNIIACKDRDLIDYIEVKNLLEPIMHEVRSFYKPVKIAVFELLRYIAEENLGSLLLYMIVKFPEEMLLLLSQCGT